MFVNKQISVLAKDCILIDMTTIHPWINFNGNAEEAFMFYTSVLGGEITKVIRFRDLASAEFPVPENEAEKIMQIILTLGDGHMLIGNDVPAFMGTVSEKENRSKIHVTLESKEEAENVFNGLSTAGEVEGPIGDSPWGTYVGAFRDRYGIEWIVECNLNK